jgi:hypothetical protein
MEANSIESTNPSEKAPFISPHCHNRRPVIIALIKVPKKAKTKMPPMFLKKWFLFRVMPLLNITGGSSTLKNTVGLNNKEFSPTLVYQNKAGFNNKEFTPTPYP